MGRATKPIAAQRDTFPKVKHHRENLWMPRTPEKACGGPVPIPRRRDDEAATTSRRPSPVVASVRIAEVGDEMLRVVRARAREKLVWGVREGAELGTSPLREEISRCRPSCRSMRDLWSSCTWAATCSRPRSRPSTRSGRVSPPAASPSSTSTSTIPAGRVENTAPGRSTSRGPGRRSPTWATSPKTNRSPSRGGKVTNSATTGWRSRGR